MFVLLSEPSLHTYTDSSPPASADALRERYLRLEARASADGSQRWLNWIVVLPAVGAIGFVQATVIGSSAWVAYLLGTEFRSHGYASEATEAMLEYLTEVHQTSVFKATVELENVPSVRLLNRMGFRLADAAELGGSSLSESERLYLKTPRSGDA